MTESYALLNSQTHADLRYNPAKGYSFAAQLMSVPTTLGEAKHIAREYVLVFDKKTERMYALLGGQKNVNAYVNDRGQWLGRYIPAQIRAYPFTATPIPRQDGDNNGDERLAILIDTNAPHFSDPRGERLFGDQGQLSPALEKIQKILMNMRLDAKRTSTLIKQLDEQGLLVEQKIDIKGTSTSLQGFRVVDSNKLLALPPQPLAELNTSGALILAYTQLFSLLNLEKSTLTERAQKSAAKLLSEDDFNFDFSQFTNQ